MAQKLTDGFVKSALVPTGGKLYAIYYDSEVKGFGVRVTTRGARSFVLNYRARGIERRLTIGSYPDWRVAAAREEAKRLKRLVDQGHDPMGERHEERAAPTVNELTERYLLEHGCLKAERSRREDESLIAQWIGPELGRKKVADLRHADIERVHRKITAYGTPTRANRAAALLSKMLSLAVRWEMRVDNPVRGIQRNHEEKRATYLSNGELRRLGEALAIYSNQASANAIRLLLLTGARRSEIAKLTRNRLLSDRIVMEMVDTKQGRRLLVPRTLLVDAVIASQTVTAGKFVFPSGGHRPANPGLDQASRRPAARQRCYLPPT